MLLNKSKHNYWIIWLISFVALNIKKFTRIVIAKISQEITVNLCHYIILIFFSASFNIAIYLPWNEKEKYLYFLRASEIAVWTRLKIRVSEAIFKNWFAFLENWWTALILSMYKFRWNKQRKYNGKYLLKERR